ncbi:MAG: lipoyl synthase [Candidatus Riflebacteria bacterium]|nr:lipoyl synthase [Candidatus Riflebacteria bacterium]
MHGHGLNTICVSGRCPNASICFARGTATFLLMGDRCTRSCRFCNVSPHAAFGLDPAEPERVAAAVSRLGLTYVVITSVTRDDLPDGGAAHFAATVLAIKAGRPDRKVEVLTPDFEGRPEALAEVLRSGPDVFGCNIETCARLYPAIRPQGDYRRVLALLGQARAMPGKHLVKSGFMVGLGETDQELATVMTDLARAGCQIVTIGQYLQPTRNHLPVHRYVTPLQFHELEERGRELGFMDVVAGPLVRSSYRADRGFERAQGACAGLDLHGRPDGAGEV